MNKTGWVSAGIFLFAFAFYLHGAAPTVTTGDSGEFITAARTLAIPHPPGFPIYTVFARLFSDLIPWGNSAYRMNLFSSACAALAIALLAAFLIQQGIALPIVVVGGILLLQSSQVMAIASTTEVFALHVLLSLGVLFTAPQRPLLAMFLLGLGFANHQTILLLVPVVLLSPLLSSRRTSGSRIGIGSFWAPAFAGATLVAFLLGASVYLVLPLRAVHEPMMNWGNPQTLERFWHVITRADYGSLTLALGETPARTAVNTLFQLKRFVLGLVSEVTWAGILAGMVGVVWACRRERKAWAWVLAFIFVGPFFFVLGNLPFDAQSNGLLGRFYVLPLFIWVLFIAYAFQAAATLSPALPWAVLGVPLLFFLVRNPAEAFPWRGEFSAYAYGRNHLKTLPPNAILMMDGGDDTFYALAYLTQVERRRPDLELHDRGALVYPNPYGADFRQLTRDQKENRRQAIERAMLASHRPLYYSTMNEQIMPGVKLSQEGILYRAPSPQMVPPSPSGRGVGSERPWFFYDLRGIRPWQTVEIFSDYRTRALLPYYAYQRASHAAQEGSWGDAYRYLAVSKSIGPDVLWLAPNALYLESHWAEHQKR